MPDKTYGGRLRENRCPRCWRNKLLHGSPEAKAYVIKNGLARDFVVTGPDKKDDYRAWMDRYEKWKARNMKGAAKCTMKKLIKKMDRLPEGSLRRGKFQRYLNRLDDVIEGRSSDFSR
jgi:hypothetical protein